MSENPKNWKVEIHRIPERVLRKLPKTLVKRLWTRIRELEIDPRPDDCVKLRGTQYENLSRVWMGSWRISYAVEDDQLLVLILEIAPRGGAYRNF